jgi:hypothetical protein
MSEAETEDLYEMATLDPKHTGLPMVMWVSERGHAQHDVRVKVSISHAPRINFCNTAIVGSQPFRIISGRLTASDRQAVFGWIALNEVALIDYWNAQSIRWTSFSDLSRCRNPSGSVVAKG